MFHWESERSILRPMNHPFSTPSTCFSPTLYFWDSSNANLNIKKYLLCQKKKVKFSKYKMQLNMQNNDLKSKTSFLFSCKIPRKKYYVCNNKLQRKPPTLGGNGDVPCFTSFLRHVALVLYLQVRMQWWFCYKTYLKQKCVCYNHILCGWFNCACLRWCEVVNEK